MDRVGSVSCDLGVDELVAAEVVSICISRRMFCYRVGFLVEYNLVAYWCREDVWVSECGVCVYGAI